LLPAPEFLRRTGERGRRAAPSLFHLRHFRYSDRRLRGMCVLGMLVALSVVVGLPQAGPVWLPLAAFAVMWVLYLSIVHVGQVFYGFGWEILLLETGAVVGLLGSHRTVPPMLVLLFLRWLLFRVEFGAGMIKMRGDPAWRDLTAMDHHHQSQPMPGPLSRLAHLRPRWWHRMETLGSHVVQLGMPFLLFLPQPIASLAAIPIILTQLFLVVTGNYAWLNWLTILLALGAISDPFWSWLAGGPWPGWGWEGAGESAGADADGMIGADWWLIATALAVLGLCVLSWPALKNLLSRDQLMNASFNRWHLGSAYGAFGSMTTVRHEIVIEGALGAVPAEGDWTPADTDWQAFEFRGKPGDPYRRPPQVAPYHLRLDWMMWFLALRPGGERWFVRLLEKLDGDPGIRRLLRTDPFDGKAPRRIRVRLFDYRFASRAEHQADGRIWVRRDLGVITTLGE
jgi:hypothetical protein